jgi:aminopeptidase N
MVNEYKNDYISNKNIIRDLGNFDDSEYFSAIYERGPIIINNIRNSIGDAKFFKAMQNYYNDFKFKTATTKDLLNEFVRVTSKEYYNKIYNWLTGKSDINYSFK